eukprot:5082907-Pyramimonas_sp.AAC.1
MRALLGAVLDQHGRPRAQVGLGWDRDVAPREEPLGHVPPLGQPHAHAHLHGVWKRVDDPPRVGHEGRVLTRGVLLVRLLIFRGLLILTPDVEERLEGVHGAESIARAECCTDVLRDFDPIRRALFTAEIDVHLAWLNRQSRAHGDARLSLAAVVASLAAQHLDARCRVEVAEDGCRYRESGKAPVRTVRLGLMVRFSGLHKSIEPARQRRLPSSWTIAGLLFVRLVQDTEILQELVDLVVHEPLAVPNPPMHAALRRHRLLRDVEPHHRLRLVHDREVASAPLAHALDGAAEEGMRPDSREYASAPAVIQLVRVRFTNGSERAVRLRLHGLR